MSSNEWKEKIYDSYLTNGFQESNLRDREFEIQKRFFKKNYLKYLPSDKSCKILELGCGKGQFYYFCQDYGYEGYEGIDASRENIEYIKKKMGMAANVHQKDMFEFLSECKDHYDVVVFNDVIEHLTKPEIFDVLEGVYEHLKKDGVFLIKTPNMANPYVSTAGRYIDITHEVGFTECSMKQVLRATKYTDIKVVGVDIYVLNPIISIIAKAISKMVNLGLMLFSVLYGRTYLRVYEKDILAIAYKK